MAFINLPNSLTLMFEELNKRIRKLEQPNNTPVISYTGTPTNVRDGDVWIDSSTNTLKVRINGVTRTVTIT
jgi:urease accessory protein UreE